MTTSPSGRVSPIDILHLIDRLEEEIGAARSLPWGDGVVISRRRLLDIIDQMRVAVPSEVKEAAQIVRQRDEVLSQAQEEAARTLSQARAEAEKAISEQDVIRVAQQRAGEIIRQAEQQATAHLDEVAAQAAQQMEEADRYVLDLLRKLESQITAFLAAVQNGIDSLEGRQH